MKKIILNVLVLFLFLSQADAQVALGIEGGIGLSRQNFNLLDGSSEKPEGGTPVDPSAKYIAVPVLTAIINIPLSQTFSIRSGLGYRQQGYSYISYQTDVPTIIFRKGSYFVNSVSARLNYLEIPLNLSIKLPFNNKRFEILTGVTFAYCLGGTGTAIHYSYLTGDEYYAYNPPIQRTAKNDVGFYSGPDVNALNFNLNLGLGYKISKRFNVNATVNYGLTNMSPFIYEELSSVTGYSYETWVNRYKVANINSLSFSFTVAYMFDFFGKKIK